MINFISGKTGEDPVTENKFTKKHVGFFLIANLIFYGLLLSLPLLSPSSREARYLKAVDSLEPSSNDPTSVPDRVSHISAWAKAVDANLTAEDREGERDIYITYLGLSVLGVQILSVAAGYSGYSFLAYLITLVIWLILKAQLNSIVYFPRFSHNNPAMSDTYSLILVIGLVISFAFSYLGKELAKGLESRGV